MYSMVMFPGTSKGLGSRSVFPLAFFTVGFSFYASGGLGLGPHGVMERMDIIQGEGRSGTSFRRDWGGDGCTEVGAAESDHAEKCPNTRDNTRYRKKKDEL